LPEGELALAIGDLFFPSSDLFFLLGHLSAEPLILLLQSLNGIDARVEQPHGCRVAQDMERDRLLLQRGTRVASDRHIRPKPTFQGIAAERSPSSCRKDGVAVVTSALVKPAAEHRDDRRGERSDPLLASFSDTADMRTEAKMDVSLPKRDELRHAEPRLDGQCEQGLIASPVHVVRIGAARRALTSRSVR
jgi:hypothetical protein